LIVFSRADRDEKRLLLMKTLEPWCPEYGAGRGLGVRCVMRSGLTAGRDAVRGWCWRREKCVGRWEIEDLLLAHA